MACSSLGRTKIFEALWRMSGRGAREEAGFASGQGRAREIKHAEMKTNVSLVTLRIFLSLSISLVSPSL